MEGVVNRKKILEAKGASGKIRFYTTIGKVYSNWSEDQWHLIRLREEKP